MAPSQPDPTIAGMPLEDTLRKAIAAAISDTGGCSLRDLSARAEVAPMTVSDFVNGKGSLRIDQAERLAKAIGMRITIRRVKG